MTAKTAGAAGSRQLAAKEQGKDETVEGVSKERSILRLARECDAQHNRAHPSPTVEERSVGPRKQLQSNKVS